MLKTKASLEMACVPMKARISRKTMDWWDECEKGDMVCVSVMITLFFCDETAMASYICVYI